MPSDLTERLAFTLMNNSFGPDMARWTARWSAELLPLLLSEPELVAGLAPEVRLSVLTPRERAVMRLGEACVWRAQVMTDPEAMYNEKLIYAARVNVEDALAEARALTPEADNAE